MSWRTRFPGTPREGQANLLDQIISSWDSTDVFVVSAPTGAGKQHIAKCLQQLFPNSSYITPTNVLLQQFLSNFPDSNTLHRIDSYWCNKWKRPCSETRKRKRVFCNTSRDQCKCQASSDIQLVRYSQRPTATNYHIYLAHQIKREVLLVDEAHNLEAVIKDRLSVKLWQHDYQYPDRAYSVEQLLAWTSSLPPKKLRGKKAQLLQTSLMSLKPEYIVERSLEWFNGKGTKRGIPELRDCLKLTPVDIRNSPPQFWRNPVRKIVLMSATINRKDVDILGLFRFSKRIKYFECSSEIPADQRQTIYQRNKSLLVTYKHSKSPEYLNNLTILIEEIAEKHKEEKGVIHATYQLADRLRSTLATKERYTFHYQGEDKHLKYKQFLASKEPKIFVASGMYEGIDLPDDLGRFQIIAKIPWMSLGNPAIRYLSETDPEYYTWEALKRTIQACGRITRSKEDWGVTYIIDRTWERLIESSQRLELVPQWFKESIVNTDGTYMAKTRTLSSSDTSIRMEITSV